MENLLKVKLYQIQTLVDVRSKGYVTFHVQNKIQIEFLVALVLELIFHQKE